MKTGLQPEWSVHLGTLYDRSRDLHVMSCEHNEPTVTSSYHSQFHEVRGIVDGMELGQFFSDIHTQLQRVATKCIAIT